MAAEDMARALMAMDDVGLRAAVADLSAEIEVGGPVEWVNVNAGFCGFYRSDYDDSLRTALLDRISRMASPPVSTTGRTGDGHP